MLFYRFKKCCHQWETVSNIAGDLINHAPNVRLGNKVYPARSVEKCKYCGKTRFSPFLNVDCDVVNFKKAE